MIKTKGLKKSYKTRAKRKTTTVDAVKGIDLDVTEGEIFGFLGPNGAGKTTTLRMLATLIPPDDGEATIAGANLRTQQAQVRRSIGFVAEADALCDRIAIIDHGEIVAEGTPDALKREISGDVVSVGVGEHAEKAAEVLKDQPFARGVEARDDGELRLTVEAGDTAIPQIMRALEGAGVALSTIELHRPTLDDVFLTKTGRSLRES